jgi:hypothetical protein
VSSFTFTGASAVLALASLALALLDFRVPPLERPGPSMWWAVITLTVSFASLSVGYVILLNT